MAKFEKGTFITLPNKQVLRGRKPATQAVYLWICEHANDSGICFPAIKTLAVESGSSESSVKRSIADLEKCGILQKSHRKNTSNEYQILIVENEEGGFSMDPGGSRETSGVGSQGTTNSIHVTQSNNSKRVEKFLTWESVQQHRLWEKIQGMYPDRNYEYQFELMDDWYLKNKKRHPVAISSFENWLKKAPIDETLAFKRRQESRRALMIVDDVPDSPVNHEAMAKIRENMKKIGVIKR